MKEIYLDNDLSLAELRESDIGELAEAVSENLPHIGAWMIWAVPDYGVKQAREFVERNIDAEPGAQSFGVFYQGKLSGCAGYVPRDEKGVAEIGYWVSHEHQGKGIVTRCARALIDHAFRYLGVDRVEIHAAALNFRSRAVAERLRFDLVDRLKDAHPLPNGIVDDLVVYSIHKRNWS